MQFISNFRRWLLGGFKCIKCNETYIASSFGFGGCICPNCYRGELEFLFFDNSFFLNRIFSKRLPNKESNQSLIGLNDILDFMNETLLERPIN